jgi:glucose/arabinose dehydrogenase
MRFILVLAAFTLAARTAPAATEHFPSSAGSLAVETVAGGLVHPWSLAFLPDGRMLVTERPGRMRIVTRGGHLSQPISGVPQVYDSSQAGLLDVILDHDYTSNNRVYFCYAEPFEGGGRIAVAQGRLVEGDRLVDRTDPRLVAVKIIFHQKGPVSHGLNIGCRIVQAKDGNLFVTLGDHFSAKELAQKLDNHIGKIVRITPDGQAPPDNPFVGTLGALPEIWAYGLRNPEGLAFNPADGKLWEQEHGPKGGDEINIIEKGANYGWPVVSFGVNYDGTPVGAGQQHHAGMIDPVWHWTPSIAPSGMAFYTGDLFPGWKGSLLNGALKFELLSRLMLDGDKAVKEERMLQGLHERIRDVRQGPDGALYLLTDNEAGRILRVAPAK